MKRVLFLMAGACAMAFAANASADQLNPGGGSVGKITRISKGVKELSLETNIVFSSDTVKGKDQEPDASKSRLSLMGAPVFRYFIIDNLAIGLHAGGFYKNTSEGVDDAKYKFTDVGFIGTLSAQYLASLGGGMFIAPMVGGGAFFGNRETSSPAAVVGDPDVVLRSSLAGGVVRGGIGLVFYSSSRFNLFARPEAIVYLGSVKPKEEALPAGVTAPEPESRSFTSIDAGFTCGASYIF